MEEKKRGENGKKGGVTIGRKAMKNDTDIEAGRVRMEERDTTSASTSLSLSLSLPLHELRGSESLKLLNTESCLIYYI